MKRLAEDREKWKLSAKKTGRSADIHMMMVITGRYTGHITHETIMHLTHFMNLGVDLGTLMLAAPSTSAL